jgi:hypothetical protein
MQEGEVNRTPDVFLEATRYRSSGKVIALGRLSCSVVKGHNQDVAKRGSVRDTCNSSSLSPDFVALTRSCRTYQILSHLPDLLAPTRSSRTYQIFSHLPDLLALTTVRRTHHSPSHSPQLVAPFKSRRMSFTSSHILYFVAHPTFCCTSFNSSQTCFALMAIGRQQFIPILVICY